MKKPYKCPFCWNRYGYEHSRSLHIRDDHKNILQNPSLMKASESLIEYKAVPEKVLQKFTLIDRHSPRLNEPSPVSSPVMQIHSHRSIDGSTGSSAVSRESSPADSPAYLYQQEHINYQTQEQNQFNPEITSNAIRNMSVLRHRDVTYQSNSSYSHLPLRKRPYANTVTNQNLDRQEIHQPIRHRSTSPPYPTRKSTSPYRISKPLLPVRVPVIVSNPYSGRLEV